MHELVLLLFDFFNWCCRYLGIDIYIYLDFERSILDFFIKVFKLICVLQQAILLQVSLIIVHIFNVWIWNTNILYLHYILLLPA